MMQDNDHLKARLRVEAMTVRRSAHRRGGTEVGRKLAENFLTANLWTPDQAVAGYIPFGEEADVMPLMQALHQRGGRLALPVVTARDAPLQFRRWLPTDPLESGPFGIRQPSAAAALITPVLLLVPLLAFDDSGARLGYGGGYYDRSLAALRRDGRIVAVGIGFAEQNYPGLPQNPDDQRLDWVVTDQAVLEIGA